MLNYVEAPPSVRFVAEIGGWQSGPMTGFDWGVAENFPYLPRVIFRRSILRPAQWRVDATTDLGIGWRQSFNVPRHVYLTQKDNRLLLDLDNNEHLDELFAERASIVRNGSFVLQECIPTQKDAWVVSGPDRYVAELTIPLSARQEARERDELIFPSSDFSESDRCKSLDSEWVYLKLYCQWDLQDLLINEWLDALIAKVGNEKIDRRYFFIRYSDPDAHIRLRIKRSDCSHEDSLPRYVSAWADNLVRNKLCTDYTFAVYERELERYGGVQGMALVERLFLLDSHCCKELMAARRKHSTELDNWDLCVLSLDRFLNSLGVKELGRTSLISEEAAERITFGSYFRSRKIRLRKYLGQHDDQEVREAFEAVHDVYESMHAAWLSLTALAENGGLSVPISLLRSHLVHLHINRMVGTRGDTERAILALLSRTRLSLLKSP